MGIDPSLTGTCMYDGTDYSYIQPKKLTGPDRMIHIRECVTDFVFCQPSTITVVEDFAFSRAQHAHDKGGLGWIIRLALLEGGADVWLMKPNSRAMLATGKGNAAKDAVVSEVSVRTATVFPTNDHCDAFLLWVAGMERIGQHDHPMNPLPKTHLRALEKMEFLLSSDLR